MPVTKEDIIAELSLLPLSTLEKLQKYSNLLIIPDEDLLVNVTMSQMVQKAFDLADSYFPDWTDRSNSDFGKYLVELIALFSEKDFYYLNAFANESLLKKMTVYSDVFIRAIELGHSPILTTSAPATFEVTFEAGPAYTYPIGALIVEIRDQNLKFTNTTVINVPISPIATVMSLVLQEGDFLSESQTFNGYRVDIRKPKIDTNHLSVTIDNVTWDKVRVFGQSEPTSKHYVVLPEEDGQVSIYFGEDGYGQKPALGSSVSLRYLKCKGSTINGLTGDASINKFDLARKATSALLTSPPANGSESESLASLKESTLNYFSTKYVVHNVDAVERWLNSQPTIKRSKAFVAGNIIRIRVIPIDGTVADLTFMGNLDTAINPYLESGFSSLGAVTDYVDVSTISLEVYHLTGYDVPNIVSLVKQLVQDYTNPLVLAEYGMDFDLAKLEFLIKSKVPGVQNVVFLTVAGITAANVTVGTLEIMQKIALTDIAITTFAI